MQAMQMSKLKLSRADLAVVLAIAAAVALAGALTLEILGLPVRGVRPVAFISAIVCLKFSLFAYWPTLSKRGSLSLDTLRDLFPQPVSWLAALSGTTGSNEKHHSSPASPVPAHKTLELWNSTGSRLEQTLFASNVPTFVLSSEQRFLDWNPAFEMVFGGASELRRGAHVKTWYELLDNFRRLPKRTDKLYGEGILPITDRERASFISAEFGRMVFTRIMTPIIDRASGRIVGWTVVLNINSVNKRLEFFERLHDCIALETRRVRFAASYDSLFDRSPERQALLSTYVAELARSPYVLELGCGTGSLTVALLGEGHKVTAVEDGTHLLRVAKERTQAFAKIKLVRHAPLALAKLPPAHYDAAVLSQRLPTAAEAPAVFAALHAALRPSGQLLLQLRDETGTVDALFERLQQRLGEAACFDQLKHQYSHVLEYSREQAATVSREDRLDPKQASLLLTAAGFRLEAEHTHLEDGHTILIVARKLG